LFEEDEISSTRRVEASRGNKRPANPVTVEAQRRIRKLQQAIADNPSLSRDEYSTLLTEDFGIPEGSEEYGRYMSLFSML
jgi:hypothetical protein